MLQQPRHQKITALWRRSQYKTAKNKIKSVVLPVLMSLEQWICRQKTNDQARLGQATHFYANWDQFLGDEFYYNPSFQFLSW